MNAELDLSGDAEMGVSRFAVPSMRCAGCISKIEKGLAALPGVIEARVNFTAKRVAVTHLPEVQLPEISRALAELGFESQPITDGAAISGHDESRALLRAMAVAGFAAMNIMLLSVSVWSGAKGEIRDLFHWISALIALPTILYSGRPFFRSAWGVLRHGRTNMDVPISIGVVLVTGLSLHETFTGGAHAYFDGAVMLLFFLLTGRWLDSVMRDRARDGVTALLRQTAPGALVVSNDGTSRWVAARDLAPGMAMLVAAGERLAADGVVESGRSSFDRSLLTGESAPEPVAPGAIVHAGTLNIDGPVTVRVSAAGADTSIAEIARIMEEAAQSRSHYVRIADRAARYYAPAVHLLALLAFAGWMIAGAGWHHALMIAAAVLIITCPCALGLAVPASQIVAVGALMRAGILVKDGTALERLAEADVAIFDKTGTLTLGRPEPVDLSMLGAREKALLLGLARISCHPLSVSLRRALEAQGVAAADLEDVRETPGQGIFARHDGEAVSLGRADDAGKAGLVSRFSHGDRQIDIYFHDALRPDAEATLAALSAMGLGSQILSGDRAASVAQLAERLGVEAEAGLSPQDKLDAIKALAVAGKRPLMVGDGLNDGPALAAGHVSMAPSSASDSGQNAADAVWMNDSLAPVAVAVRAARRTLRVVKENFALAIGYNIIAVPLALAGIVTPLIAALAMSGSSLVVVANALRLRSAAR